MNHGNKPSYFPLNPGTLIGILIYNGLLKSLYNCMGSISFPSIIQPTRGLFFPGSHGLADIFFLAPAAAAPKPTSFGMSAKLTQRQGASSANRLGSSWPQPSPSMTFIEMLLIGFLSKPIGSTVLVYLDTHIWLTFMVNVGKYTILGGNASLSATSMNVMVFIHVCSVMFRPGSDFFPSHAWNTDSRFNGKLGPLENSNRRASFKNRDTKAPDCGRVRPFSPLAQHFTWPWLQNTIQKKNTNFKTTDLKPCHI